MFHRQCNVIRIKLAAIALSPAGGAGIPPNTCIFVECVLICNIWFSNVRLSRTRGHEIILLIKVALTYCRDVRRVKFVVRESAQQTCFPNPRISEKQESKEHIVLLSHGVGCTVVVLDSLFQYKLKSANSALGKNFLSTCNPCLLKRWTEGFCNVLGFVVHWRLVNKTGMLSGSLLLAVGAVDHCQGRGHKRIKLPLLLFSIKHQALNAFFFFFFF